MNKNFLQIAETLTPTLIESTVFPFSMQADKRLNAGDSLVFDFGNHYVGYVAIQFSSHGSIPDAPAYIKLKFCETRHEIDEDTSSYNGWISKGWIQEEYVHIDELPGKLSLDRRYAFRYIKLEVIAVSSKYSLYVEGISCKAVTSVQTIVKLIGKDERERTIDKVALRTLSECMQSEFEDGPKRDRRLWLGDLRLQALTNYETFKQNDLVKRCLYLFAGTANDEGQISACVFTKPKVAGDDTFMFDYSLLFIPTLLDYYANTQDLATVKDLLQTAFHQLQLSQRYFDENDLVRDSDQLGWCFLDWDLTLNKQAGAQAVYITCAKAMCRLYKLAGENTELLASDIAKKEEAAKKYLYDSQLGLFVSGSQKQISYASNVWFVLADILCQEENARLLAKLASVDAVKPVTPYMVHHYVEALLKAGMKKKAYDVMITYWGAMIDDGADTFYELFNPECPNESPYGSQVVNSYCHAWSCTPAYLIRKYFGEVVHD